MSVIWTNDDIKERIFLLSPTLQESFLRAADALHQKESVSMLSFIQESRIELNDTHREILREQEVLRDTSDLLASKRIYGDLDEFEENFHEMNAVDDYLKKRNQGFVGGLNILSYEDEKSHKKSKRKDKDKEKEKDKDKEKEKDKKKHKDKHRPHSHAGGMIITDENENPEKKKKDKKDKKDKRDKDDESEVKSHKHKKNKDKDRDDGAMKREKSAPVIMAADPAHIEKETNDLMQEFITRQTSDMEQKSQFEEAIKRKLARKKNPLAAEAEELLRQQAWADEEHSKEKAAYEAKMMEKLKAKRERTAMSKEASSLDASTVLGDDADDDKKREKKKKKKKDKDEEDPDNDDEAKKEKKKHKKKDKENENERDDSEKVERKKKKKDRDEETEDLDVKEEKKKKKKKERDDDESTTIDDEKSEEKKKKKKKERDDDESTTIDDEKSEEKKKKKKRDKGKKDDED